MIGTTLRLESRTSPENFDDKSMSFYGFDSVEGLAFVLPCKELVLVHVNNKTEEKRVMVIDGLKFFNKLQVKTYRKKKILVYRYT